MKQIYYKEWFLLFLRLSLAAAFIYAGVIKLKAPQEFADSIAGFKMLPNFLIVITALALPPFEIISGGFLLTARFKHQAAFSVLILSAIFALALSQAIVRGLEVDCGCFGGSQPGILATWISLGRDLLLMAGSGWLYYTCKNSSLSPSSVRRQKQVVMLGGN